MLDNSKSFLQKRAAAQAKQRENSSVLNIGTFAEYMAYVEAAFLSSIRHKNRYYITLYGADKTTVLDNVILSQTLESEHEKQPYTQAELLDFPVYGVTAKDSTGAEIYILSLGVVPTEKTDLISLADLMKSLRAANVG